jgi:hypothetical protein
LEVLFYSCSSSFYQNRHGFDFFLRHFGPKESRTWIHINRGSANFFEILFDQLQKIKMLITGKVLGLKHFGNLLVMNGDMEAVQVIGAAGGEDQERGRIRGVVGGSAQVTRAACGDCRLSRAAQRVVMLWGGELTLSGMRSFGASM